MTSRPLLLLCLALTLTTACAGTPEGKPRRVPDGHTGAFTTWWSDTQIREEGEYLDGQRNGKILIYHPDGSPQERCAYVNGVPDGPRVRFHPGGVVALTESITDGMLDGERRDYDDRGRPLSLQTWVHGRRNGPQVTFHANGRTSGDGAWRDDLPVGNWRHWDEEGRLASEEWFWAAGGKPVGALETVYDAGGAVASQGLKHRDGEHWIGWRTYWHRNGVQSGLVDYVDDRRSGRDLSWSASGLPLVEGQRLDDRRVGLWTTYDDRGRVDRERDYGTGEELPVVDEAEGDPPPR